MGPPSHKERRDFLQVNVLAPAQIDELRLSVATPFSPIRASCLTSSPLLQIVGATRSSYGLS